jgi:hypothetical protein
VIYTYIRQFAETFLGIKKLVHALDNVDTKMELPSPTVLNERRVSGQPAQAGNGEFTVTGRKLLLSDITLPSSVIWIGVHSPALWSVRIE